jgi:hypothetical protein
LFYKIRVEKGKTENKMKKLIVMLAVLVAASAQATLKDETPGGFTTDNPPLLYGRVLHIQQLAGANIFGSQVVWSPFEPFGPNQFSIITNGINGTVSWNLTQTDGFFLQYVLLEGVAGARDHIYAARAGLERIQGDGFVTIDDATQIQAIIFFGTNVVPETGTTILLLGFGAGLMLLLFSRGKRHARQGID